LARILIVEDDVIIATDIQSILKSHGHVIVGNVRSGQDAIQIGKIEKPDLIIMDILLADRISGIEVGFIVESALRKRIPIIYLTALQKDDFPELGDQLHKCAFISKPFKEEDLIEGVARILQE